MTGFLMPPHPSTNVPKIKYGAYAINLDEYKSVKARWIVLYLNGNNAGASHHATYFNIFEVGYIPRKFKIYIDYENIITNIYRIQA